MRHRSTRKSILLASLLAALVLLALLLQILPTRQPKAAISADLNNKTHATERDWNQMKVAVEPFTQSGELSSESSAFDGKESSTISGNQPSTRKGQEPLEGADQFDPQTIYESLKPVRLDSNGDVVLDHLTLLVLDKVFSYQDPTLSEQELELQRKRKRAKRLN